MTYEIAGIQNNIVNKQYDEAIAKILFNIMEGI